MIAVFTCNNQIMTTNYDNDHNVGWLTYMCSYLYMGGMPLKTKLRTLCLVFTIEQLFSTTKDSYSRFHQVNPGADAR